MAQILYPEEEEGEEKWVHHYSSFHQILLVGDGDFSFSLCLALSFGSASNIVATSLDPYDVLIKKYKNARSNLETLDRLGAYILHGVDATKMRLHTDLLMRKFDRIIYNFPHAGFYGKEDNALVIRMHQKLVHGFFKNASGMLRAYGEIHVNHKTTPPFCQWNISELASQSSLSLMECVDFKREDYPGYKNKRGAGARCDDPFPIGSCSTFKFIISRTSNKTRNFSSPYINPQEQPDTVAFARPCFNPQQIELTERRPDPVAFAQAYVDHRQIEVIERRPDTVAFARPYFNPQQIELTERRPHPVAFAQAYVDHRQIEVIERRPDPISFARPSVNPVMYMDYVPRSVMSHPPTIAWNQRRSNFNDYLNYVTETFRETSYSVKYLVEALRLGIE